MNGTSVDMAEIGRVDIEKLNTQFPPAIVTE